MPLPHLRHVGTCRCEGAQAREAAPGGRAGSERHQHRSTDATKRMSTAIAAAAPGSTPIICRKAKVCALPAGVWQSAIRPRMIGLFGLLLATLASILRSRRRLLLENALLRQQLQVTVRGQPRPCPRTSDKLFWLIVRRLQRNWRLRRRLRHPHRRYEVTLNERAA